MSESKNPGKRAASDSLPMVEIVRPTYQPSKAKLEEDVRVTTTFEKAVEALCQPVQVRYVSRPRRER